MSSLFGGTYLKLIQPDQNANDVQNRKNQEQKITGLKERIEERKRQVYLLDLQGFSNIEISKKMQVSLSTIEKDLHFMKYYSAKWYKEIFSIGLSNPLLDSCNLLDIVQKELWKMFRAEEKTSIRKKLLDSIVSNSIKKRDYFRRYHPKKYDQDERILQLEREIKEELKQSS